LAWMIGDGHVDDAYAYAIKSEDRFREFLAAAAHVDGTSLKQELYGKLRPLMFELPEGWSSGGGASVRAPGLEVAYYYPITAKNVAIETLRAMKPAATGVADALNLKLPIIKQRDRFALLFRGRIHVSETGTYHFYLTSDDGSRLYIDGKLVVNNDGLHGMVQKSGQVNLAAGTHDFVLTYFDNGGNDGLRVAWSGPGFARQDIPADVLSIAGQRTLSDAVIELVAGLGVRPAETFADLLRLLQQGRNRAAVISGLQRIPPAAWPKELALPLANSLVAYLTELPPRFRTSSTAKQAIELARRAATMLPVSTAREIERRLQNLDVRVIAIGTVPHRMIYDKEQIVVQAGKPVEFRFTNTDNMPHNFCITLPGSMEEVGTLAEQTARDPDAMQRQYVPRTDKIILASRLLQPGQSQTLLFEVPSTPGVYPYICTYPGHWRRMYGALYVVENFAAYQADPVDYLAKHPLPIKDEMLKYISRGREWTLAELEPDLERLGEGRAFEVGKQLFKVAACVACHKLNGEGQQIGPDLTKLDPKLKPRDVLESILEPSKKIDPKYQPYAFLLADGRVIKGLVIEQTKDAITVIENPLARSRPVLIPKEDIEEKVKSDTSLMPKGLLNKLTREEILDLLAYVYARGNPKHPFFQKHHEH
ncbi:MAG: dehydrogenase, partial [Planctomycetota bacterium]